MKQVHLLYFSPTHTTKKVLSAIGEGFGLPLIHHNLTDVHQLQHTAAPVFSQEDVVIIGVPVYAGRVPYFLTSFLTTLKGQNTPCALVALYGNREFEDCLAEMYDMALEQGFVPVGAAAFIGQHSFSTNVAAGRPNQDDLSLAHAFGADLGKKLQGSYVPLTADALPGNRPYREVSSAPNTVYPTVDNARCNGCKACVAACPFHNIDFKDDKALVLQDTCIKCHGCVRTCPTGAIAFTNPSFLENVKNFEAKFGKPDKQPVLFL